MQLRQIEESKIHCAKEHFKVIVWSMTWWIAVNRYWIKL
ncbi:hypothetical protein [Campylobacter curvus]